MNQTLAFVEPISSRRGLLAALILSADVLVLGALSFFDPLLALILATTVTLFTVCALSEIGIVLMLVFVSQFVALPGISDITVYVIKWCVLLVFMVIAFGRYTVEGRRLEFRPQMIEIVFAALVVWGLVCSMTAVNPTVTVLHSLRLLALLLVYILTTEIIKTDSHVRKVLIAILIAVVSASAYSLLALSGGRYLRIEGFFTNANSFGIFLSFTVPLLVLAIGLGRQIPWRLIFTAGAAVGIAALLLSWSRAAILSVLVQFMVYLILEKKKKTIAACGIILVATLIAVASSPTSMKYLGLITRLGGGTTHRSLLWEKGLVSACQHPVMGVGYDLKTSEVVEKVNWGNFAEASMLTQWRGEFLPHNHFIYAILATGIPGLILTLMVYWAVFRQLRQGRARSANAQQRRFHSLLIAMMCGVLANSFFESGVIFGIGAIGHYFWIALGMVTAISRKRLLEEPETSVKATQV
jgi:O-antigen ligase